MGGQDGEGEERIWALYCGLEQKSGAQRIMLVIVEGICGSSHCCTFTVSETLSERKGCHVVCYQMLACRIQAL